MCFSIFFVVILFAIIILISEILIIFACAHIVLQAIWNNFVYQLAYQSKNDFDWLLFDCVFGYVFEKAGFLKGTFEVDLISRKVGGLTVCKGQFPCVGAGCGEFRVRELEGDLKSFSRHHC